MSPGNAIINPPPPAPAPLPPLPLPAPPNPEILIYLFNSNPQSLLQQGYQHNEVTESQKSFSERRSFRSQEVVLDKRIMTGQGDFWIISAENNSYLFPKGKTIPGSLKTSAKALFEGYKSGDEGEFTLVKPAKVAPVGTAPKWKLVEKGELKYRISPSKKLE